MKDYSEAFYRLTMESVFQEVFDIIKRNSNGTAWLIGGAVYRNLAHLLYGVDKAPHDFDFIVKNPNPRIELPSGWERRENEYGNPKFVNDNCEIDFVPLTTVHSIVRRGLEPSFPNYLTGTPLTVQAIGYNILTQRLEGDVGLNAVRNQTVGVNNLEQAKIYEGKKGKPIQQIIREKAESLGFKPIYRKFITNSS